MLAMSKMQELIKKKLLDNALLLVPFDGWCSDLLKSASVKAGYDRSTGGVVFHNGIKDLFRYYVRRVDQEMIESYKALAHNEDKTHQRIRKCLIARLEVLAKNKLVLSKSLAFLALPTNCGLAMSVLYNTVNLIWYEAGHDKATDWSYYTKRITLAAVYSSTLLYFSNDASTNFIDTIAFLDRRLIDAYNVGKTKNKFTALLGLS